MKYFLVAVMFLLFAGCTDTDMANITSLGKQGHIRCYSGGKLIYEGTSTGKLQTVSNSDGWEFEEKETHKFIRVSGDCIIEN